MGADFSSKNQLIFSYYIEYKGMFSWSENKQESNQQVVNKVSVGTSQLNVNTFQSHLFQ